MLGRRIANYEILGRIGSGGMGEVYRARDSRLGREVALKFLPPQLLTDPVRLRRFEREAQLASSINHPSIVTIYELGEHEGRPFIAMELIEGDLLRTLISGGPLPLDRALDIATDIAEGMARAHANNILHRDIKPENVIVDREGRARILDFGLAISKGKTRLTADSTTVGTTHYMSPEQATDTDPDRRTDIWSLGVVLYEMVAGEPPFRADHDPATIYSIIHEAHRPLTERRTNVPVELERIVDKMLAKDRAERYPGMEDVLVDLRRARGGPTRTRRRRVGRKAARVAAVALVAAIGLVAGGMWLSRDERAGQSPKSIAVLPFANMSDNPDNEYFSDGLSEELLNSLARLGDLRVAARTSSWQFKGRSNNVADIGRELNVSTVLEGSVRRSGERLRVTVQLVNTRDGFHLWSETYDRELGDVFAIQRDIATRVVRELEVRLLYEESEQLARRPTHNLKAYESYLRARHLMARRTSTAIEAAIGHFQRAVELDPEFALAHVGLAEAHLLHGDYGTASYEESVPVIERSIYRALEIDGRLGEAFTSLAALREMQARLVEADSLYQRGVELAPSYATGYHWYGTALGNSRSEADKAEAMLRKAVELDPLSPVINAAHAQQLRRMGHFAEALAGLERVVELDEDFPGAYLGIADIYYREYGRIDEALEKLDRAIALDAGNLTLRYTRASFLAGAGRIDEAIAECRAAIGASPDWATGYMMAGDIYHKLGQIEGALACYREVAVSDREDYWGEANWAGVLLEMGDERTAEALIERLPPVQSSMLDMGLQLCRLDVDGAKRAVDRLASLAGLPYFDAEIAEVALLEGRHADVLEMYRRVAPDLVGNHDARIHSNNLDPAILIAAAQIGLGETESARWLLSKCAAYLESLPETMRRYEYGRQLAEVYALQGRRREALDALASGVDQGLRNGWCITMCSPMLASIRDEPEFTAIFEEIRVDLAAMRARLPAAQRTLP